MTRHPNMIEDLLGFQASHDKRFTLHPLLPEGQWDHFYLGDLRYHGHDIDILWRRDWDDSKPGNQSKLIVWVDGRRTAESEVLTRPLQVSWP